MVTNIDKIDRTLTMESIEEKTENLNGPKAMSRISTN